MNETAPILAVITSDIIDSTKLQTEEYEKAISFVKKEMSQWLDTSNAAWWVQRGDAFQMLLTQPSQALESALFLKVVVNLALKDQENITSIPRLDIRSAIGLGSVTTWRDEISESTGPAFILAGKAIDEMKRHREATLKIVTEHRDINEELALVTEMFCAIMSRWSYASVEVLYWYIKGVKKQADLAEKLGISQSSVQRRMEVLHMSVVESFIRRFKNLVTRL